jgi:hypothetical protein
MVVSTNYVEQLNSIPQCSNTAKDIDDNYRRTINPNDRGRANRRAGPHA